VPYSGSTVTYTAVVTNHNAESVTLTSLTDSAFGDLDGQGTCAVPQTLAASGGTYTCTFTQFISGPGASHTNVVEARAEDNDGNSDTATDDATVEVRPQLIVNKVVNPTSDTGLFNLQINGTTYAANVGKRDDRRCGPDPW
jgi:hypothetical protein